MTVCKLGRNKMKISLTDSEVKVFFGDYTQIDYSDQKTRMALSILLHEALPESEFENQNGRMMIEVNSIYNGGCEILLTKLSNQAKRQHKSNCVIEFADSENMLLAVNHLYKSRKNRHIESSLYKIDKKYYIIINTNDNSAIIDQLSEYYCKASESEVTAAYTKEYGKLLSDGNAIAELGNIFS